METSDHVEPREPCDVQHTLTSSSAETSDHVVGTSLGSTWLLVSAEDDVRFSSCRYSNPNKFPQIFELPVLEPKQDSHRISSCRYSNPKKYPQIFELPVLEPLTSNP